MLGKIVNENEKDTMQSDLTMLTWFNYTTEL